MDDHPHDSAARGLEAARRDLEAALARLREARASASYGWSPHLAAALDAAERALADAQEQLAGLKDDDATATE